MRKNSVKVVFAILAWGIFLAGCDNPANETAKQKFVIIRGLTDYSGKFGQFVLYSMTTGYPIALTKMTEISNKGSLSSALYEYPNDDISWDGSGEYGAAFAISSTNPGSDIVYEGIIDSVSVVSNKTEMHIKDFTSVNLNNNTFKKSGDSIVFYSEGAESSYASYSYLAGNIISGTGSIKVLVRAATENNNEEFGIEYGRDGAGTSKIVNFYINMDGEYCIYWFDGSNSSSSYLWKKSTAIKTSVNEWNELRIDYNTVSRSFSFFINGTKVLDKTFASIDNGYIIYHTSLRYSEVSRENPYRLEFKTTSPYSYP
jgi:hypothetical protein